MKSSHHSLVQTIRLVLGKSGVLALGASALISSSAFAGIEFTGGADGSSRDLSLAANWSAAPSDSETATIDVGTFGGTFAVSADLALSGLTFANGTSSQSIDVSGDGLLTLGAGGLTLGANVSRVTLRAKIALAAAQTWTLLDTPCDTYASVSGKEDWTISLGGADAVVRHYAPLGYGGHVTYSGTSGGTVRYLAGTNWANKVTLNAGVTSSSAMSDGTKPYPNLLIVTNEVRWSDIFTGRELEVLSNVSRTFVNFAICQPSVADAGSTGAAGRVIFEDGDVLVQSGDSGLSRFAVAQGTFEQRGGTINYPTYYQMRLSDGALSPCRSLWDYNGVKYVSQRLEVKGGALTTSSLEFGEGKNIGTRSVVAQSGGTVTASVGVYMGMAAGTASDVLVEYLLSGGLLSVGSKGSASGYDNYQSCGLILAGAHQLGASSANIAPTVFDMSGGELRSKYITFGGDYYSSFPQNFQSTNSFGVFNLSGGTVHLQYPFSSKVTGAGFKTGYAWNRSATNSHYRISFRGGTVSADDADYTMDMGVFLPPSATSFAWDTGASKTTFAAPISGEGSFVKKGSGELVLTDATRFHGTLDVAEGTVSVASDVGGSDTLGDCYKWCADDLLTTLEDGATVTEWPAASGGASIVSNSYVGTSGSGFAFPTLAKDAGFNGHAALRFGKFGSMMLPAKDNPLCGLSTGTVVVVFRGVDARSRFARHYGHQTGPVAMVSDWGADAQFKIIAANDLSDTSVDRGIGLHYLMSGVANKDVDYNYAPIFSKPGVALGEDVHVVVATISGGDFSLYSDGYCSSSTHAEWNGGKTADGKPRSLATSGLYLASRCTDGTTQASFPCLISELRIYPNRAFARDQQRELATLLYAKYRPDSPNGWDGSYAGAIKTGTETTPEKPEGGVEWDAAALSALSAPANCSKPAYVENALNGKPVVRFAAESSTALAIPSADAPTTGADAYTVAVVFRTTAAGCDDPMANYFDDAPGLLSSMTTRTYNNNFVLSFGAESSVTTAFGHPNGTYDSGEAKYWRQLLRSRKPCRLNDGLPHVAVAAYSPKAAKDCIVMMTDGMSSSLAEKGNSTAAHGAFDLIVGASSAKPSTSAGYFTGDVAAVRVYGRALSRDEMRDLSESFAAEYGFRLLPTMAFGEAAVKAFGLGATNIVVRQGATLRLPASVASPFALGAGVTLSGSGTILGSYRFDEGSTLDLSAEDAVVPEVVTMAGGTLKLPLGRTVSFGEFHASGVVNVALVGERETFPARLALATFENSTLADGTTWRAEGLRGDQELVYKESKKTLYLRTIRGCALIVR